MARGGTHTVHHEAGFVLRTRGGELGGGGGFRDILDLHAVVRDEGYERLAHLLTWATRRAHTVSGDTGVVVPTRAQPAQHTRPHQLWR